MELRSLLALMGDDWEELDERIWLLSLENNLPDASKGASAGKGTASTSKHITSGSAGKKKKKNTKKGSKSLNAQNSSPPPPPKAEDNKLDIVDVLDLSAHRRQQIIRNQMSDILLDSDMSQIHPFEITDEHTIATLSISINALRLPHTSAKLHSCAAQHIQKMVKTNPTNELKEQLIAVLIQAYLSQLKLIATMPSLCTNSSEESLENARSTLKAWEEAQFLSMTLLKYSGSNLHQSWLILSVIEHYKSCKYLLTLLEKSKGESGDANTYDEEIKKMVQKVGMLPRLAEMMTMKQIKAFANSKGDSNSFSPSADDVRLYVESLELQSKYEEALDLLEELGFKDSDEDESTNKSLSRRKINDENEVNNFDGSLIQMTEKEAFEIKVQLLLKLDRHDHAFRIYSEKLLPLMPDQWAYWKELLKCSTLCADQDRCIEKCKEILDRVLQEEEKKSAKVPLRGPHLFTVEMAAHCVETETETGLRGNALRKLADTIVGYGTIFAPKVFCCFQDVRDYIGLLVQKSAMNGIISDDIQNILSWTLELRRNNSPVKVMDTENTSADKQERRSKLRAYISSVKMCFEIWFHLRNQCEGNLSYMKKLDEEMSSFIPTSDEMIRHWYNTMDLGSNPADGGQKEYLPGDDLILLTIQLMLQSQSSTKTNLHVAVLLEDAMHYSPYNPYLKIAAINIHIINKSANCAWEVFQDMTIKQIQLDSCSYFILPYLNDNGLYNEALEQAGKIIRLHTSSEKDLCSFMAKALENGNLHKGREMICWQREKMTSSLQLQQAKGLVMDLAPLMNVGGTIMPIGAIHGLCGEDNDAERATKIVRDSTNVNSAPSLLNLARENTHGRGKWSDNRDFDINQFEILQKTSYPLVTNETLLRAHLHAVLTRLVLLTESTKHPKKGKIVKIQDGETLDKRSKSLWQAIEREDAFASTQNYETRKLYDGLRKLTMQLSKATCIVASGRSESDSAIASTDSLSSREEKCIVFLNAAQTELIDLSVSKDFSVSVYTLLPDILITMFATFKITAKMCSTFGWGKRKWETKPVAHSLAELAEGLNGIVKGLMQALEANASISDNNLKEELDSLELPTNMVNKVFKDIVSIQNDVQTRISPVLKEIMDKLESFNCL